ncbi:hypothetical protein D3C81_1939570 [compost metagenome]
MKLRIIAELARKCVGLPAFDTLQELTYIFDDIDSFSAYFHLNGEQVFFIPIRNST